MGAHTIVIVQDDAGMRQPGKRVARYNAIMVVDFKLGEAS